jgi:hypothetical protein
VACETTFPRHEYLPESLPASEVVIRLVEETMAQTRSHNGSYEKCIKERIQKRYRNSLPFEESFEDKPSEDESRYEKDRIPSEFQWTDGYDFRADSPIYD